MQKNLSYQQEQTKKFHKMHAILLQLSYLHNIPLSHQKNQKTDTCCTLMDVI